MAMDGARPEGLSRLARLFAALTLLFAVVGTASAEPPLSYLLSGLAVLAVCWMAYLYRGAVRAKPGESKARTRSRLLFKLFIILFLVANGCGIALAANPGSGLLESLVILLVVGSFACGAVAIIYTLVDAGNTASDEYMATVRRHDKSDKAKGNSKY